MHFTSCWLARLVTWGRVSACTGTVVHITKYHKYLCFAWIYAQDRESQAQGQVCKFQTTTSACGVSIALRLLGIHFRGKALMSVLHHHDYIMLYQKMMVKTVFRMHLCSNNSSLLCNLYIVTLYCNVTKKRAIIVIRHK